MKAGDTIGPWELKVIWPYTTIQNRERFCCISKVWDGIEDQIFYELLPCQEISQLKHVCPFGVQYIGKVIEKVAFSKCNHAQWENGDHIYQSKKEFGEDRYFFKGPEPTKIIGT